MFTYYAILTRIVNFLYLQSISLSFSIFKNLLNNFLPALFFNFLKFIDERK